MKLRSAKMLGRGTYTWDLAGTDIGLQRKELNPRGKWVVVAYSSAAYAWLRDRGVLHEEFDSRSETVKVLAAFHASDPIPPSDAPDVKLNRVTAGQHETPDGRFLILRDRGGWAVRDRATETDDDTTQWCGTLHQVRAYIDYARSET